MLATSLAYNAGEWSLFGAEEIPGEEDILGPEARILNEFPTQDEATAAFTDDWLARFHADQLGWSSAVLYAEARLREAVHLTETLEPPCSFLTALTCALMQALTPSLGEYAPVMPQLTRELFRSVFSDYDAIMDVPEAHPPPTKGNTIVLDTRFFAASSYATTARKLRAKVAGMRKSLEAVEAEDGMLQEEILRRRRLYKSTARRFSKGLMDTAFRIWRTTTVGNRHARASAVSAVRHMFKAKHSTQNLKGVFVRWRTAATTLKHNRLRQELKNHRIRKTALEDSIARLEADIERARAEVNSAQQAVDTQRRHVVKRRAVLGKLKDHLATNRLGEAKQQALCVLVDELLALRMPTPPHSAWASATSGLVTILVGILQKQLSSLTIDRVDGTLLRDDISRHRYDGCLEAAEGDVVAALYATCPQSAIPSMAVRRKHAKRYHHDVDVYLPPSVYATLDNGNGSSRPAPVVFPAAQRLREEHDSGSPPRPSAEPVRLKATLQPPPRLPVARSKRFLCLRAQSKRLDVDNCPAPGTIGVTPAFLQQSGRQHSSRRSLTLLRSPVSVSSAATTDSDFFPEAPMRVLPCPASRSEGDGGVVTTTHLFAGRNARREVKNLTPSSILLRWVNFMVLKGAPGVAREVLARRVSDRGEYGAEWQPFRRARSLTNDVKDGRLLFAVLYSMAPSVFDAHCVVEAAAPAAVGATLHTLATSVNMMVNAGLEVASGLVPAIRLAAGAAGLLPLVVVAPVRGRRTIHRSSSFKLAGDASSSESSSSDDEDDGGGNDSFPSSAVHKQKRITEGSHAAAIVPSVERLQRVTHVAAPTRPPGKRMSIRRAAKLSALVGAMRHKDALPAGLRPTQKPASLAPLPLLTGKDVYQGNALWVGATVAQLMSTLPNMPRSIAAVASEQATVKALLDAWKPVAPYGVSNHRNRVVAYGTPAGAALEQTRRDPGVTTAEQATLLRPNGRSEPEVSALLDSLKRVVSGATHAMDFAEEEAMASEAVWQSACDRVQEATWHRVTAGLANADAMSLQPMHKSVSLGGGPKAFGKAGSKRLVDARAPWFTRIAFGRVHDVLRGSEDGQTGQSTLVDINTLLEGHATILEMLFNYYAHLSCPGVPKPTGVDNYNFWRFVKDAKLLGDVLIVADVDYIVSKASRRDDDMVDTLMELKLNARPHAPTAPPTLKQVVGRQRGRGRRPILPAAASGGDSRCGELWMGPVQFVEAIVRLGVATGAHSRITDRVRLLLEGHIMPMIDEPSIVDSPFRNTDMLKLLAGHKQQLLSLFRRYSISVVSEGDDQSHEVVTSCRGSISRRPSVANIMANVTLQPGGTRAAIAVATGETLPEGGALPAIFAREGKAPLTMLGSNVVMDHAGWLALMKALELVGARLTPARANKIYDQVQPRANTAKPCTSPLVFTEFCEAMASVAMCLDPDPFTRPHMIVHRFFVRLGGGV